MSYKFIFPKKDAWIAESSASVNFGGDQILELKKEYDSLNPETFVGVTRILSYFDLTSISSSIVSGEIPAAETGSKGESSVKYFLKLYSTEASELPTEYTLIANPLSQSFEEGSGFRDDVPVVSDGVSWTYTDTRNTSSKWLVLNEGTSTSGSRTVSGGGNWYTGSGFEASQSFSYESPDVNIDITQIVNRWLKSSGGLVSPTYPHKIVNHGLVLMFTSGSEADDSIRGDLKFFSSNTHTVYAPRLVAKWDASEYDYSIITGSAGIGEIDVTGTTENHVYVKGIRPSYKETDTVKFRIGARKRFITRTFSNNYQTTNLGYIPEGSGSYSIIDLSTNETIVPFDEYTKLSCDVSGSYFKQDLNTFHPNRFYKIIIKVKYNDNQEIVYDNDEFEFKVVQ